MANKCILVVDDEPAVLKFLSYFLQRPGFEIRSAQDGQKALDSIQEKIPDLVFLDIRIPVVNGYEVCRKIKSDPKYKRIPVVFLTADANARREIQARGIQAEGCILKPFDQEEITKVVDKYLSTG